MFDRGFKSWCEKFSASKRAELEMDKAAPIDAHLLAKSLGIRVWTPKDVLGLSKESLDTLLYNDGSTPSCWSAVTLVVANTTVVILNSSHSIGRQASDLTHELAHRILDHKTHEVNADSTGIMMLSAYDKKQENEADWLSSCLLLPRDALVSIKRKGISIDEAARSYGVSKQMLNYRMAMTGINRQFAR